MLKKENMKKVFVISACFGYYDLTGVKTIFATESEETAKAYCDKANRLMKRYMPYFVELYRQARYDLTHALNYDRFEIAERLDFVAAKFSYSEVEVR